MLLKAARELMAEKGFPRVTVREVAERAGVGAALVHYYFGNKDGLLREVVAEVAGEARDRIQHSIRGEGDVRDRLRGFILSWVDALAADPYAARLLVEQVLFAGDDVIDSFVDRFARPNSEMIAALLAEGRETGELRDVDAADLLPSLVGMCLFIFLGAPIVKRIYGVEEITPEIARNYAQSAADLVLNGIAIPPGANR